MNRELSSSWEADPPFAPVPPHSTVGAPWRARDMSCQGFVCTNRIDFHSAGVMRQVLGPIVRLAQQTAPLGYV